MVILCRFAPLRLCVRFMILNFPDFDALRLAMTSGAVPPAVALTAAVVGFDDQNQVWVETAAPLAAPHRTTSAASASRCARPAAPPRLDPVSCWPEILPLRPDADPIDRLEQTPILFETAGQDDLGRLVVEILRLGNDRQRFRWLESKTDADEGRGLLRVVGPPYYSLLRAIDRNGQDGPRAYRKRAARLGRGRLDPPAGRPPQAAAGQAAAGVAAAAVDAARRGAVPRRVRGDGVCPARRPDRLERGRAEGQGAGGAQADAGRRGRRGGAVGAARRPDRGAEPLRPEQQRPDAPSAGLRRRREGRPHRRRPAHPPFPTAAAGAGAEGRSV